MKHLKFEDFTIWVSKVLALNFPIVENTEILDGKKHQYSCIITFEKGAIIPSSYFSACNDLVTKYNSDSYTESISFYVRNATGFLQLVIYTYLTKK